MTNKMTIRGAIERACVSIVLLIAGASLLHTMYAGSLSNAIDNVADRTCMTGQYRHGGQCVDLPDVASPMAQQDAVAEGQDVLTLAYSDAPADLWDALLDAGFHGTAGDGCECLYIPVGTEVIGDHGIYAATLDGWTLCRVNVATGGRCTPRPIDVPIVAPVA